MRRHWQYLSLLLSLALLALIPANASAAAPAIVDTHVSDPTTTSIVLNASIDPEGKATKYHFEYGAADCASNPCTSVPLPEPSIGSGTEPVFVSHAVEGLPPGTLFHYRVVAKNGNAEADRTIGPDRLFATYAPPPTFASCPNEEFRSGALSPLGHPSDNLPDCRAYEQASPTDKDGVDARGSAQRVRAATDGSAIAFGVTSGIPGGSGAQHYPLYLASRGNALWSTQGLNPPATVGPEGWPLGWTPDFATSFAVADASVAASVTDLTLIARDSATGQITTIVPYGSGMTNIALAATSPDGSIALFESFGGIPTIPGTLPGKLNLYLWQRATNTLSLAGVLNDGTVLPSGVRLGVGKNPYGNPSYKQDNHALAADGSYIFTEEDKGPSLTAEGTGKLYQRLNPTQPQSATDAQGHCTEAAKACTVEISATEKTNGKGGDGHDAAGPRPAFFQTATPDGSQVFFTSPEKLTDDATTGPEPDKQAAIARANLADGSGVQIEFLPAHAKGIAVDPSGEYIYWADPGTNSIGRAKLGAGGPEDPESAFISVPEIEVESEPGVFEEVPARPQYVAIDPADEYVYWTNAPEEEEVGEQLGTIGRAKLGAGGPEDEDHEYITGASNPQGIAVNGEFIYWANDPPEGMEGNTPELDEARTIGRAKPGAMKGEEVNRAFIEVGQAGHQHTPQGIAINATHLYAAVNSSQSQSYILRFDLDDGKLTSVDSFLFDSEHQEKPGLRGIALDSGHVYWTREGEDSIGRANLELEQASPEEKEWIKGAGHPSGIAVDAGHLYWATNQDVEPNPGNDLYRYDRTAPAGQRLTDLAPDTTDPDGVDVAGVLGASSDGSYLYYAASGVPNGPIANSPNQNGEEAESLSCDGSPGSRCNLYLSHNGTTTFIAQLDGRLDDTRNWASAPVGIGGDVDKRSRVSADGSVLLFSSKRRLTPYDNTLAPCIGTCPPVPCGGTAKNPSPCQELYRYDVEATKLLCVSCDPSGAPPVDAPDFSSIRLSAATTESPASTLTRNLSADGRRVFFETRDRLLAADTNGLEGCAMLGDPMKNAEGSGGEEFPCLDVYEWEAPGSGSCTEADDAYLPQSGGCLYLISTGTNSRASFFADASTDGDSVFLFTRDQLVRQDGDQLLDLYSARVDGGLTLQNTSPPTCEGEACKAGATPQPEGNSPGSSSFSGPANPTAKRPRCAKGKQLRKSRCVAKKRKTRGHHRKAGSTRRGHR